MTNGENPKLFTSEDVSKIIGVSEQIVKRWCEKGRYPEAYKTEDGHWLIPKKHFKISLEQARKRNSFDEKLYQINQMKGEFKEDEFL